MQESKNKFAKSIAKKFKKCYNRAIFLKKIAHYEFFKFISCKKGREMKYFEMSKSDLLAEKQILMEKYNAFCEKGLRLDLSRGKPNGEQLDVSEGFYTLPLAKPLYMAGSTDCRNYGILEGLPEMRDFFAELLCVPRENVLIGGNSSLQLMFDALMRALVFGFCDSPRPWAQEKEKKWICVVPGYDRHFRITEQLGFELLSVNMKEDGPDMDAVEALVKDPAVKGIWCVPKYSNPTGNTYSEEVVRRLVSMKCAAPDFRIMWDNAYAVHDLEEKGDALADVFALAKQYGNENRVLYFASTSKVTLPGAGVAMMAASEENRKQMLPIIGSQTIGYDKMNQLRHLHFFGTPENAHVHMQKLGKLIFEKFRIALAALETLKDAGIAEWTKPRGGYFITLTVPEGTAKRVHKLMSDAGVVLTPAGATHPHGIDPTDSVLRLAPTYPTNAELKLGCEILAVCVRLAAVEKLLLKETR